MVYVFSSGYKSMCNFVTKCVIFSINVKRDEINIYNYIKLNIFWHVSWNGPFLEMGTLLFLLC